MKILVRVLCITMTFFVTVSGEALSFSGGQGHSHGGGGGGGGGRIGIGIRINIGGPGFGRIPPGAVPAQPEPDPTKREIYRDESTSVAPVVKKAPVLPARKLIRIRVPYLQELAMDIDRTLIQLAWTEPVQTIKHFRTQMDSAKKRQDLQGEREALINLGHIYYLTGQFSRGAQNYLTALEISKRTNNPLWQALELRNLAAISIAAGNYDDAEMYGSEAMKLFESSRNNAALKMALINAGVMEKYRGRFFRAFEEFDKALSMVTEQDRSQVLVLNNAADLYRKRGYQKRAGEAYAQAVQTAQKLNDPELESETLFNAARAYLELGKYEIALNQALRALDLANSIGKANDVHMRLIGEIYLESGQLDKAESYFKEADFDSSLGRLYLAKAQFDLAEKSFERLMAAAQKDENLDELFVAYLGLGKIAEAKRNLQKAETNYLKASELVEEMRSNLLLSERKNFFSTKVNGFSRSEPAKCLIGLALKQNKPELSISSSEMIRSRDFSDAIALRSESEQLGVPQEIISKEKQINSKLASLKSAKNILPKSMDTERYNDFVKQIKSAESERASFIQALWRDHKQFASVKYPKPLKFEETSLSPTDNILIYDILDNQIALRLVSGKKVVFSKVTEIRPSALEEQVSTFRHFFENPKTSSFDYESAQNLYKLLLADALPRIPRGTKITVMPDGPLALVPFEALASGTNDGTKPIFAGDLNQFTYYQSLNALSAVRNQSKGPEGANRTLVIADPVFEKNDSRLMDGPEPTRLAQTDQNRFLNLMAAIEDEGGCQNPSKRLAQTAEIATKLTSLNQGSCDVLTGLEADKEVFLKNVAPKLSSYRSVVFATHGYVGNQIPGIMEPVLALTMVPPGKDGYLTMTEVSGLKMNADLAALVACQTGVGAKMAGEGVMSMGRAFQCAGARSVLMTLWSVDETASVKLMESFFEKLHQGMSKSDAWSTARSDLRKSGYDNPFFWAGFIMVGETN